MEDLLKIAIEASIEAGKEILKIYHSDFSYEIKNDDSPLTLADKNANDCINSFLQKTAIPIISEENRQIDYSIRKEWNMCWIVDPLDGTKEFIKKNGEFTVNIALIKKGEPVFGVIYVPVTKELYYSCPTTQKSFKKDLITGKITIDQILAEAKELIVNKNISKKIKVVGSRSHMNRETETFIDNLKKDSNKTIEIVSKGSSLKFCLIAEGKAAIYPRFAPTMEWDTAAGQAICSAAGAKVIALDTNSEMTYNKENLLNSWFKVSVN